MGDAHTKGRVGTSATADLWHRSAEGAIRTTGPLFGASCVVSVAIRRADSAGIARLFVITVMRDAAGVRDSDGAWKPHTIRTCDRQGAAIRIDEAAGECRVCRHVTLQIHGRDLGITLRAIRQASLLEKQI